VDVDAAWLLARITDQMVKDELRANGEEAIERGAFGSPTMYLDNNEMFFGVDRLPLLRIAMERQLIGGA
jgi:2-hydroxychromene-2-carboxylate isomerase